LEKEGFGGNPKYCAASGLQSLSFRDEVPFKTSLITHFSVSWVLYTSKEQENMQVFLLVNLAEV